MDEQNNNTDVQAQENEEIIASNGEASAPVKKQNPLSSFIDYIELFVIAICLVIVLFSGVFRICTVDGSSMNKTLTHGEVLVVSDTFYTPQRGDIVVFHQTDDSGIADRNKPLVKRVIGVGGDKVTIDYSTWTLTITDKSGNAVEVDEEDYRFLDPARADAFVGVAEYDVPEGELFVLGDNRRNSLDSRFYDVGFVDARRVLGRVIIRVAPLSKLGTVN